MNTPFDLNKLRDKTADQFPTCAFLVFSNRPMQVPYGDHIEYRTVRAAKLPNEYRGGGSTPYDDISYERLIQIAGLENYWDYETWRTAPPSMDNHFHTYIKEMVVLDGEDHTDYVFEVRTPFCD